MLQSVTSFLTGAGLFGEIFLSFNPLRAIHIKTNKQSFNQFNDNRQNKQAAGGGNPSNFGINSLPACVLLGDER